MAKIQYKTFLVPPPAPPSLDTHPHNSWISWLNFCDWFSKAWMLSLSDSSWTDSDSLRANASHSSAILLLSLLIFMQIQECIVSLKSDKQVNSRIMKLKQLTWMKVHVHVLDNLLHFNWWWNVYILKAFIRNFRLCTSIY